MFTILMFLIAVKLTFRTVSFIKYLSRTKQKICLIERGLVTKEDLCGLTSNEFRHFCEELLSLKSLSPTGTSKLSAYTDGDRQILVEFRHLEACTHPSDVITKYNLQKLAGVMAGAMVYKSIVITSGEIDESAYKYLKSLPKLYSIDLISGTDLIRLYNEKACKTSDISLNLQKA